MISSNVPSATNVMSDPRALPCLHTFCLKCIEKHGKRQSHQDNGNQSNCPLCRQLFTVSGRKYSNLPKDFLYCEIIGGQERNVERIEKERNQESLDEQY